jgi:glycerophosphoryl diester phosphodiesterase
VLSSKPSSRDGILAWAHRGGEGQWPSNTLYAFERALSLGMDALELDIHATVDGVLVVRHDPVVETTTDGLGRIGDLTLDEIKRLDAGYTWTDDGGRTFPFRGLGITIPTLDEVFKTFPNTPVSIDIKPKDPGVVPVLCQLLRGHDQLDKVVVGTFHDAQLSRFRRLCPEVDTAAGISETRAFFLLSRARQPWRYHSPAKAFMVPEYVGRLHVVTPRFIRTAHARGMQVHVWTVNQVGDMRRLIDWGVDGLITDYPSRLLAWLKRGSD